MNCVCMCSLEDHQMSPLMTKEALLWNSNGSIRLYTSVNQCNLTIHIFILSASVRLKLTFQCPKEKQTELKEVILLENSFQL